MSAGDQGRSDITIRAFVCTWSHFSNEDLGSDRDFGITPRTTARRVVCTGSIDPEDLIRAMADGADGIFVGTCEPGSCKFEGEENHNAGNRQAVAKIHSIRKSLKEVGLEPARIRSEWTSPDRPERLQELMEDFEDEIADLGPIDRSDEILEKLEVLASVLEDFRSRWLLGKKLKLTTTGNTFGELIDGKRFGEIMAEVLRKEYIRQWLLHVLEGGPSTVEEMSEASGFTTDDVLAHLMRLRQKGLVSFHGDRDRSPVYRKEVGQ